MRAIYCDCFSGISGDMFLAAAIDAGFPVPQLQDELRKLQLPAFTGIDVARVQRGAISATHLEFRIANREGAQHRHLGEIEGIIARSNLPDQVKDTAKAIFANLAKAEAKVHGIPVEAVHFHEVGADDAILDIVGAAVVLHYLEIDKIYTSALPLGSGTVHAQHGMLPVPAPATLELLRACGGRVRPAPGEGELVTPTGAAILSTLAEFSQPAMKVEKVGIGAGKKEFSWPNILRVIIGDLTVESPLVLLETNIDDMNPEFYGFLIERLFAAQALYVFLTPIMMKKNRPAEKISVLARTAQEPALVKILLEETSTLGVRKIPIERYEAGRTETSVQTTWGMVRIKIKHLQELGTIQVSPEYEDCAAIARQSSVPLIEIYQQALSLARKKYNL